MWKPSLYFFSKNYSWSLAKVEDRVLDIEHGELNPIELIWTNWKGFTARNNTTFKVKDVKILIILLLQELLLSLAKGWRSLTLNISTANAMEFIPASSPQSSYLWIALLLGYILPLPNQIVSCSDTCVMKRNFVPLVPPKGYRLLGRQY